ncbi:hypothetical protein [Streptomyces sp. NPDC021622]|uniref:hypothetical protein n=1 Tax=Streptomyces sp. NPDC021622 TaxID=3155013 RepID=UPI0033EB2099
MRADPLEDLHVPARQALESVPDGHPRGPGSNVRPGDGPHRTVDDAAERSGGFTSRVRPLLAKERFSI